MAELGQHGTDRLDSEPVLLIRDERYECGSRRSSFLAKKADAAFKFHSPGAARGFPGAAASARPIPRWSIPAGRLRPPRPAAPTSARLARGADLRRDRADRLPLRAMLTRLDLLKHQRDRAFPHVTRVCLAPCHDQILHSSVWSLHQTRGGSCSANTEPRGDKEVHAEHRASHARSRLLAPERYSKGTPARSRRARVTNQACEKSQSAGVVGGDASGYLRGDDTSTFLGLCRVGRAPAPVARHR
jgi:hypothetical protein